MFRARLRPIALLTLIIGFLLISPIRALPILQPSPAEAAMRARVSALSMRYVALSMRYVRSPYPGLGTSPRMEEAIAVAFPSSLTRQALNVAWCESRGQPTARNGQYRGHFQIGASEWRRFGSGDPYDAIDNARAAYRYYLAVGSWRPWQCQP